MHSKISKKKIFFFSFLTLFLFSMIFSFNSKPVMAASPSAPSASSTNNTLYAADLLNINAYSFAGNKFTNNLYNSLNVIPYGITLESFTNLGEYQVTNSDITYFAKVTYHFDINQYLTSQLTDAYSFKTSTYTANYGQMRFIPSMGWTISNGYPAYVYYPFSFQNTSYSIINHEIYSGNVQLNINFAQQPNFAIQGVTTNFIASKIIPDGNYTTDSNFGGFSNVIDTQSFGGERSYAGENNQQAQTEKSIGTSAGPCAETLINDWFPYWYCEPYGNNTGTTGNGYISPTLQQEHYQTITSISLNQQSTNNYAANFNIDLQPQLNYTYRYWNVNYFYCDCVLGGTYEGLHNPGFLSGYLPFPIQQGLAVGIQNPFVGEGFNMTGYIYASVPMSFFTSQNVPISEPVVKNGKFLWDGTSDIGNVNIPPSSQPFVMPWWGWVLIVAGIGLAILIFVFPDLMMYKAGESRALQNQVNGGSTWIRFTKAVNTRIAGRKKKRKT